MKVECGEAHRLRTLIHKHQLNEHSRAVVCKEGGHGVTHFYKQSLVNVVDLHKQMNIHEHTQHK